jgi:hypothetical protein
MQEDASTLRREALILEMQEKIDPDHNLDPRERRRRAEEALRAYFRALGKRSGHARRLRAARLAEFEEAAVSGGAQ